MSPRKYTEAVKQSNRKWDAVNLDRLSIAMPKGKKATVQSHAATHRESVNSFINRAIDHEMERDNTPDGPQDSVGVTSRVSLPSETLEAAQMAAKRMGETAQEFIARAVDFQTKRDNSWIRMGVKPSAKKKDE